MECLDQRPISSEEWELLYNHMPICEALVREGVDAAAALFRRRVEILAGQTSGPPGQETAFVLLTSLNRSLYDFLLLEFGVSLAQCCYRHRAHACDIHSACAILRAARAMLEDYAAGLRHSRANRPHIEKACLHSRALGGGPFAGARVRRRVSQQELPVPDFQKPAGLHLWRIRETAAHSARAHAARLHRAKH